MALVAAGSSLAGPALAAPDQGPVAAGDVLPTRAWTQTFAGWNRSSSPVIADVDGDGANDIVFGHQDGKLRVVGAADGSPRPGWPQTVSIASGAAPSAIDSSPAVGDLDRDGDLEIAVGMGSTWRANQQGGVVVFEGNGKVRCRFGTLDVFNIWSGRLPADGFRDGVYSSPAIGDVDGDRYPDIVFGSFDHRIYAMNRRCRLLPGFPVDVEDTIWSSPALFDVDRDGRAEIFIGGDQTAGGWSDWAGGELHALDWRNGTVHYLWKRRVGDVIMSSPAIGDIDGDGRFEVVVGAGNYYGHPDGTKVYAWQARSGARLPGWPVATAGPTSSSPALGDLTGDGVPEVVIGSRDGYARAWRGNGSLLWAKRLRFDIGPGNAINASPVIADVNGDGDNDVVIGNDWGTFLLGGRTGRELGTAGTWASYEATPAVADFGPLGWRMVLVAFDTPQNLTRLFVYRMPDPGTPPPWPMWRQRPSHTAAPKVRR